MYNDYILAGIGLKSDKWNYRVYMTHAIIAKYRIKLNENVVTFLN